jgi:hypothetical protein
MHADPFRRRTVNKLAAVPLMSRSTFVRRLAALPLIREGKLKALAGSSFRWGPVPTQA